MNDLIITQSVDPWHNLALEELLFDAHSEGVSLYLWRNQNTVVIGRNQNAWKECRIEELERDGGKLARRSSGGGAVFHDLGNLNFTFTATKALYDIKRQLQVIINAVGALGIPARFTGRNDIVTESGAKFSGNAFRYSDRVSMHHGTILVDVDMGRLSQYLVPSKAKLRAKGVDSVRARVANLTEYVPSLTVADVREAVIAAFAAEYGECRALFEDALPGAVLAEKQAKYASWEWRCGASPRFDLSLDTRFPWGGVELQFSLAAGRIASASAFSDAMDEAFILRLPAALTGLRLDPAELAAAVAALATPEALDVAAWLREAEV